jgi:type 1 glutamine amidotransferase
MDTKLTLNINKNVVNKAKKYAKKQGRSLSDVVENYLKAITINEKIDEEAFLSKLSPEIRELVGIAGKAPKDFDYKKEIEDYLTKKYLK